MRGSCIPNPPLNMPVVSAYEGTELLFVPQDRNWSFVSCDRSGTEAFVNVSAVEGMFGCLEEAELASFFLALVDIVLWLGNVKRECQPSVCAAALLTCSCYSRLVANAVTLLWISLGSHHTLSRIQGARSASSVCAEKYCSMFSRYSESFQAVYPCF